MLTATYAFKVDQLQPVYNDPAARQISVALVPGTYARGTVLGILTAASVNDVQTVTISGSPTGGTWSLYNLPGGKSLTGLAYNISLVNLAAAINAVVPFGSVAVTGTPAASYVITASGAGLNAQFLAPYVAVGALTGGSTPTATNVHTTSGVGPNGAYAAYASGNSDGTQLPVGVLEYACTVNNDGSVLVGGASEVLGFSELTVPMYFSGAFRSEECPGIDTNAITKLGGHLVSGTATTGVFVF